MSNYTSISIIYNPNSTGPSESYAKELHKIISKKYKDIGVTLQPTKSSGHAEELSYEAAKSSNTPLIISSSGDGGYNEVVNGAMRAQAEGAYPICAVLPAGNANDHGESVPEHGLLTSITRGTITNIDLLEVSVVHDSGQKVRFAHSYVGLGLTPVAAVELNQHTLNSLKELWIVTKTLYKFRPFKIQVKGKNLKLDSLVATNISRMAKVLKVAKNAKPDDGVFEVLAFSHTSKLKLISKLIKASTRGLYPNKHYKKYEFKVLKKTPMQLDGEVEVLEPGSVVSIRCQKQVLRTLV